MWYEWESIESFDQWHETKKQELGYPLPSINQATGEIDLDAQWTTEVALPIEVEGKIIASVADSDAEGLIPTNLRPIEIIDR